MPAKDIFHGFGLPYGDFQRHVVRFLGAGEGTKDDELDFGEWSWLVASMGLMARPEIVRLAFSYIDTEGLKAVSMEQLLRGADALLRVHPTGITLAMVRSKAMHLQRDRLGQILQSEFEVLDSMIPAVSFPAFDLRRRVVSKVLGEAYWEDTKAKYQAVRRRLRRLRELKELADLESPDPAMLAVRLVESCARRSRLVRQAFIVRLRGASVLARMGGSGTKSEATEYGAVSVGIVVPDMHECVRWAKQRDFEVPASPAGYAELCSHKGMQREVLKSIQMQCKKADLPGDQAPRDILLVPTPFSLGNRQLAQPQGRGRGLANDVKVGWAAAGAGSGRVLLNRRELRRVYGPHLEVLALRAARKKSRGVFGEAAEVLQGLWPFGRRQGHDPGQG